MRDHERPLVMRTTCRLCDRERRAEIERLAQQAGEAWIHLDGHGDAYAATEDRGYELPACHPCYGAVGPYSAVWFSPERNEYRCSGCLRFALEHPRRAERERLQWMDETPGSYAQRFISAAVSIIERQGPRRPQ